MSHMLKAFVTRLKNRRRLRLWREKYRNRGHENSSEKGSGLTEQMAHLNLDPAVELPTTKNSGSPMPHVFGQSTNFEYDFAFTLTDKAWPGPHYDQSSLFAPGVLSEKRVHTKRRPKQKSSKRKLSQGERPGITSLDERLESKQLKPVIRIRKPSSRPQYYGSPPPRDPPLHLLDLPGEIRNQIYRLLCLSDEPLSAQFRHIIKPKQGRNKKSNTLRRFPREPVLALGCRQLQQEVLSLFYGENKFVFHRSDYPKLPGLQNTRIVMTRLENIQMWAPKFGFVDSLTHLEFRFKARDPSFSASYMIYSFVKLADGKLSITNGADDVEDYCTCFDRKVLRNFESKLKDCHLNYANVLQAAMDFTFDRRAELQEDAGMSSNFPYTFYRPVNQTCDECGLERLKALASGL